MSWREDLPEDIRGADTLKDIEDVGSLAKQFIDQSRFLGNSVRIPGEDASSEDRAAFRAKLMEKNTGLVEIPTDPDDAEAFTALHAALGMPKEASEYAIPEIEGVELDAERAKSFAEAAHAAGMSKKQFEKVMGVIFKNDAELIGAQNDEHNAAMTTLRTDWGDAFEGKIARAKKIAELTGAPAGLIEAAGNGKLDAGTLRWLDGLGASLGGEAAEMVNQAGGATGITPMEAREKADEIMRSLDTMAQSDPRYAGLVNKRVEFIKIATKNH